MEKRNLYKPDVKKGGVNPKTNEPAVVSATEEFKEDEVFTAKKEKKKVEEPPPQEPEVEHEIDIEEAVLPEQIQQVIASPDIPLEPVKKPRKKRELTPAMRENLKRMNEKSTEVRRKKKEERLAREAEAKRIMEEKIREKHPSYSRPVPETTAIQAMETPPAEVRVAKPAPPVQQVSTRQPPHNYDDLIQGVVGALRQDKYYSQIEQDIRQDERRKAEKDYNSKLKEYEEKQHKTHQREVGFSILAGNGRRAKGHNSTFLRTQALRSKYGTR
jgi:hypothetical protein